MTSPSQIAANQQNAQSSTGPRTPEGKAASSQNAIKYGLTSRQVLLPFEDPEEFAELRATFVDQLRPANPAERLIVEDITVAKWHMIRTDAAQKTYIQNELEKNPPEDPMVAASYYMLDDSIRKFRKYHAAYNREYESAWKKLAAMQKERREREQQQQEQQEAVANHEYFVKRAQEHYAELFPEDVQNEPKSEPTAPSTVPSTRAGRGADDL